VEIVREQNRNIAYVDSKTKEIPVIIGQLKLCQNLSGETYRCDVQN